jgi:glycine/D-amino acid oxidase-like deaminating enzyme
MRVLILGCGYVGGQVALEMARAGHEVWGVRLAAAVLPQLTSASSDPNAAWYDLSMAGLWDAISLVDPTFMTDILEMLFNGHSEKYWIRSTEYA